MKEILIFSDVHRSAIAELIVTIQRDEFAIPITLDQQPDLKDIAGFYQNGDGNFWVAVVGSKVVGTIALLDIGNRQAALRKMFVAAAYRGSEYGIASALLATLLEWCRCRSVRQLFLGTTDKFLAAHRFYEKNGFSDIAKQNLPAAFPIMNVDTKFYCLTI